MPLFQVIFISKSSIYIPKSLIYIPAKQLHNHNIVSLNFNHFPYMRICDKLNRQLYMLDDIYLNVDEC